MRHAQLADGPHDLLNVARRGASPDSDHLIFSYTRSGTEFQGAVPTNEDGALQNDGAGSNLPAHMGSETTATVTPTRQVWAFKRRMSVALLISLCAGGCRRAEPLPPPADPAARRVIGTGTVIGIRG